MSVSAFIPGGQRAEGIGYFHDASDDPYDLRPAAALIIRALEDRRAVTPADQPVVMLMGEPHDMPSRIELMRLVAEDLREKNHHVAIGIEYDHHMGSVLARHAMGKDIPDDMYYRLQNTDTQGRALLSSFLGYGGFGGAPVAFEELMADAYAKNIPAVFDCPALYDGAMDFRDEFTAALTRRHLAKDNIDGLKFARDNEEGMLVCFDVANMAMAEMGIDFARKNKAAFILQQTGLNHVFGSVEDRCLFENSLYSTCREAGAGVVPVFPTIRSSSMGMNNIPEEARVALRQAVVIDGLAEESFGMQDRQAEIAFIAKLREHSGISQKLYDVAANKEYYKDTAHRDADRIIEAYRQGPGLSRSSAPSVSSVIT